MQDEILYNTQVIGFLEEIWGDGFCLLVDQTKSHE